MKDKVDTLIVVANDQLLQVVPENTPLTDAFLVADDILRQGVVGISDIIVKPGLVNVDFADVRTIMGNAGKLLLQQVCVRVSIEGGAANIPGSSSDYVAWTHKIVWKAMPLAIRQTKTGTMYAA
jgi:hypothetical protein